MSNFILRHKLFFISALSIPASATLLNIYLQNNPLPASKTRTIKTSETLSTTALSSAIHKTVNPRNHNGIADSRSISLSKREIGNLTDEEILARFLKGFFGGWVFTPERKLIDCLKAVGMNFIPVGFSNIEPQGPILSSLSDLSSTSLPPRHTALFGGNFLVLDHQSISPDPHSLHPSPSFLEIGYGDNRKKFAGFHRFEVFRERDVGGKEDGNVTICFSSFSCNPTVNRSPFPKWVFKFHIFYAQCLFRDGIREVLGAGTKDRHQAQL